MKYAADFRKIARETLYGKWKLAILVCFIALLLGGTSAEGLSLELELEGNWAKAVIQFAGVTVGSFGGGRGSVIGSFLLDYAKTIAMISAVVSVFTLVFGCIVEVGYHRFHLNLLDRKVASLKDLFQYFYNWKTVFIANLLELIYVFIGLIFLIVPGIIMIFNYRMVSYILAEYPEMTANEALRKSKEMMKGNRWRLFCLEFSFIGWEFLCAFTLGIGQLWLIPYKETAVAAFYRDISKTWDESADYVFEDNFNQRGGIFAVLIIFVLVSICVVLLKLGTWNKQESINTEEVDVLLQEYENEVSHIRWKYDIDLEKLKMTPELIERLNSYITLDDNKRELDISGFMSEIALFMNGEDVTIYQSYGPLKGYFIKNVPTGSAFSESTTIEIRKGTAISDIQLDQGLNLECNCSGNGPSDGALLADGQKATHKTYYKVLYGTILFSEEKGYFIDENTAYLADKSFLSSVGSPSYAEVGNEILSFESSYDLQIAIENEPMDFAATANNEKIFSKAFWNNVTSIEYYEGSDIPYVVTNEAVLQEIGFLFSDLEYKETKPEMLEGGYFFNIYTENGEMCSIWVTDDIVDFHGIDYRVSTEMLGDRIQALIMENYGMSIHVEEYVTGDYRIRVRDLEVSTEAPLDLEIRFLTDKEENILQNSIDTEKEYDDLDVKLSDETDRTKAARVKLDEYELNFKFDIKTCEVFDVEKVTD